MPYEPTPGVLTEEDKMRLVLANTGAAVPLPEELTTTFDATPKPPESDHEGAEAHEATPKVEEASAGDKAAEEARQSTMEHMNANPEITGAVSPNAPDANKPEPEAPTEGHETPTEENTKPDAGLGHHEGLV